MPARPRDNRTPDGAKRRWTPEERAARGRSSGSPRGASADGGRAAKRAERFGEQGEERRTGKGVDWYPGPRTNPKRGDQRPGRRFGDRDERPRRDDRAGQGRLGARDERPRRDDRDAGRPNRHARPERELRPSRAASDRPSRPDRRPSDRTERPQRRVVDRASGRPVRNDRNDRNDRFDRNDRRAPRQDERRPQRDERRESRFFGGQDRASRFEPQEDVVLDRLQGEVVTAEQVAGRSFADLGLGEQITKALAELGATEPFPIQAATIPAALAGRNVLGRGRTGSGKTIAFGAAVVERLLRNWAAAGRTGSGRRTGRPPRALILAPTRELALQIDRTVQPIARAVGLYTTQIVGGVPQARQVGALAKGVDIVIGTPGRIEDLLAQRRLDLGAIEIAVLDEADHMADLGFLEPIQRLLRQVPAEGQRLLFSATLDAAVTELVDEFLPDPDVHEVAEAEGSTTADHRVLVIEQGEKLSVLAALVGSVGRSLVFARTRAFAEQLADELDGEGVRAESLHGDLNQARRTRNLARFSEGKVAALVATDVAARGIHVDDVELVVHADSAEDYKTYLHRSGRTGRAGASGTVVTLITARRRRRFTELLERAGIEAEFTVLRAGEDPVAALAGARRG
ncbi:DEAD/DEAH box helicase [Amnibacterium sp.]|uniref:DEAD/DEAH box helicase n=1 Tax=Amnibacterium sp. TaxID=1872496 RepID=UPI003F7BE05D